VAGAEPWLPSTSIEGGRRTILIVDDDPFVAGACARTLEWIGYEGLTALGGKRAIELVRRHERRISLVILDMAMPELNGLQTHDALREIAPGIKVLLASGSRTAGEVQEMLARGCSGFIQKPFDAVALSSKLVEIL
jgi:CheY-like chemotaxis protein